MPVLVHYVQPTIQYNGHFSEEPGSQTIHYMKSSVKRLEIGVIK